jgi:NADPH-dependent 7-cyano-7-deazaguanine reductase QueF-like protein
MKICSAKTFKNATSGRLRELLDQCWMCKEKAKDFHHDYYCKDIWYFYTIFCPDQLESELEEYSEQLVQIAKKINEKVLARSKNLNVYISIFSQTTFHECDRYYRMYLQEVSQKTVKESQNSPSLNSSP